MKAAIIPNLTRENALDITKRVCVELNNLNVVCLLSDSINDYFSDSDKVVFLSDEQMIDECDLVISIGGDGSMIHAAKQAAVKGKRILGINAGQLAYLCGVDAYELQLLDRLVTGEYEVEERMLLRVDRYDGGKFISTGFCVNDLVVSRGQNMNLVDIEVNCSGQHIADYIADGVIVSTATGSTAYNLAAGGPIAEPTLEAMILTPICPHQLNLRPYIFHAESVLELCCGKRRESWPLFASFDGETPFSLEKDTILRVTKSAIKVDFIKIKRVNFVDVLNAKMAFNR